MRFSDVVNLIAEERERQDAKWGSERNLDPLNWLAILTEEVGEVAKAILESSNPLPINECPRCHRVSVDRDIGRKQRFCLYIVDCGWRESKDNEQVTLELIQVAAVAVCWLEAREEPR